ncbi:MAG: phage holin [Lachnospiraceae bacterium]|nr:phage holin [Lachnospiraceae bacterium]
MKKKPSAATIARTIILALAIANNALAIAGKSPLPISNEEVTEVVSFVFTTVAALVAWWKNNSFTQKAIAADETFKK